MSTLRLLALALGLVAPQVSAQQLATAEQRQELAALCVRVAKAGHAPIVGEMRRCLKNLGAPRTELDELDKRCRKELARRARPRAVTRRTLAGIAALARDLATRLPDLDEDARADLGFEILALDDRVAAAHQAVGHKRGDGQWVDEEELDRRKRCAEIRAAIRKADELEFPITVRDYKHPVHELLGIDWGIELRYENLRFISHLSRERSERIFRQALRAAALHEWLISGRLVVHRAKSGHTWVLVEPGEDYEAAVDAAVEAKGLAKELAGDAKQWSQFHDKRGWTVQNFSTEQYSEDLLLEDCCESRDIPPFLAAGLCNWTSETMLGCKMPTIVVLETERPKTGVGGARQTNRVDPVTYREAGTYGGREWMKWLLSRGSAPGIPACFVDAIGKVRGEELVKCTLVAEYWIETGPLLRLVRRLSRGKDKTGFAFVPVFEKALDLEIADFEYDWRRWLLGPPPSVFERLAPQPARQIDSDAQAAMSYLTELRKRAFAGEQMQKFYDADALTERAAVHYHAKLSDQALLLAKHLAEKDATSETAAKSQAELDALRAAGSWRVGPELIDNAATDPERTLDYWMGSVYQRVALLDPGLVGLGWAKSGEVAVADAGSLVNEPRGFWAVTWPVDGSRRVPIRHSALTPSPVPTAEPDTLGYPITLLLGPDVVRGRGFAVELSLHERSQEGPLVDCWMSTPDKPTNPRWAPRNTWSLIPKAPLLKGKTYHARAVIHGQKDWTISWSFRT